MVKGHASAVGKIFLHSDSENLVVTGGLRDGRVNVYDMRTSGTVKAAIVHKAAINMLTVGESGHIVTASADQMVKKFDMRGGEGKNLHRVK